jgi:hypothetical protein
VTLTQKQFYELARRRISQQNEAFMELVNHPTNPMTNLDLKLLIQKRPEIYGKFAGFLGKLKD